MPRDQFIHVLYAGASPMIYFSDPQTMTGLRSIVMPAIGAASERARAAGIPIKQADIMVDSVNDELVLGVMYRLIGRHELIGGNWRDEIAQRLMQATRLFHRTTQAKALCVDRRRLTARGDKARKAKPIRVGK
jgi:hypothetical protein